jgi:hypothetical protein
MVIGKHKLVNINYPHISASDALAGKPLSPDTGPGKVPCYISAFSVLSYLASKQVRYSVTMTALETKGSTGAVQHRTVVWAYSPQ